MVTVRAWLFLLVISAVLGKSFKNRRLKFSATKGTWYRSLRQARDVMIDGNEIASYVTSSRRRTRRHVTIQGKTYREVKELCTGSRIQKPTLTQCEAAVYSCYGFEERDCSPSSNCRYNRCWPIYYLINVPNHKECFVRTNECKCGLKGTSHIAVYNCSRNG